MAEAIKSIQRSKYSLGFNPPGAYQSIQAVDVSLNMHTYNFSVETEVCQVAGVLCVLTLAIPDPVRLLLQGPVSLLEPTTHHSP